MRFTNLLLVGTFTLAGCSTSSIPTNKQRHDNYLAALSSNQQGVVPESKALEIGVEKFKDFYSHFSGKRIQELLPGLYAENAYFRDGIKEVKGLETIREYFSASVKNVHSCQFKIVHYTNQNQHSYFRWEMQLQMKEKDPVLYFTGMSHVIFNSEGKIVFHQDYWDFSELLQEIPFIGSIIRSIKSKF